MSAPAVATLNPPLSREQVRLLRLERLGKDMLQKCESKVPSELVALTYGSLITQLLKDFKEDVEQVNRELEKMGFFVGQRLVDELLAKGGLGGCEDFREVCDVFEC